MEWFVKGFVKASLVWLTLGITLGVAMAIYPAWIIYRPAHLHMLVLGFVTMMIYGVAYHVIPRFAGTPLYSRRAPAWHLVASNFGLALMVLGFVLRATGVPLGALLLAVGGVLSATAAYTFAFVLWRTMDTPVRQPSTISLQRAVTSNG